MHGWHFWAGLALGLGAAAAAGLAARASAQVREMGFYGRVEVKQVEAGYRLEGDSLKVRTHLVSGLAVDYDTRDALEIDRLLEMTQTFAAGRSRLFVDLEGGAIKAFQLSVP
jgi:hypothetical protein